MMKNCVFMSLALVLVVLSWGMDLSRAQQRPAPNPHTDRKTTHYETAQQEAAAKRAEKGQMRSVTPAQRKAAAERLKAKLDNQKEQVAPASGRR